MKLNSICIAVALLSTTQGAWAGLEESRPAKVIQPAAVNHFTATLGIAHGGDTLGTAVNASNNEVSEKVRAGDGYLMLLGYVFGQPDFPVSLQLNAGYLNDYEDSNSGDGSLNTRRKVLEAIPFYNWGPHRLGLGIALHKDTTFYGNALIGNSTTYQRFNNEYEDETGPVLQYDYRALDWLSLGARASWFKYELEKSSIGSVAGAPKDSGRNIGLQATFLF